MTIYSTDMTISVTAFKAHCLAILRQLEQDRRTVEIRRRGRVIARLMPAEAQEATSAPAWQRLRGSGRLGGSPGDSVLRDDDFEAASG